MTGNGRVRGTVGAADGVAQAISSFQRTAVPLAEAADAALRKAERHAVGERNGRKQVLDRAIQERQRAEKALAACEEDCGGLERALRGARQAEEAARERHDRSVRALALTTEAGAQLAQQSRTFLVEVERSSAGSQSAAAYRDHLKGYLANDGGAADTAGASPGRGQADSGSTARAMAGTLLMMGREGLIQLGVDLAERHSMLLSPDGMDRGLLSTVVDVVRDPGMRQLARAEFTEAVAKVTSRLSGG